jgi:hypothetical protein
LKRVAVIRYLVNRGCFLLHHGKRHDIYQNLSNGKKAPIPRHNEIKDTLFQLIKKQLGIE